MSDVHVVELVKARRVAARCCVERLDLGEEVILLGFGVVDWGGHFGLSWSLGDVGGPRWRRCRRIREIRLLRKASELAAVSSRWSKVSGFQKVPGVETLLFRPMKLYCAIMGYGIMRFIGSKG